MWLHGAVRNEMDCSHMHSVSKLEEQNRALTASSTMAARRRHTITLAFIARPHGSPHGTCSTSSCWMILAAWECTVAATATYSLTGPDLEASYWK